MLIDPHKGHFINFFKFLLRLRLITLHTYSDSLFGGGPVMKFNFFTHKFELL